MTPALRQACEEAGVEILTPIWHRAEEIERTLIHSDKGAVIARAAIEILANRAARFYWVGDMHSGTYSCAAPNCPDREIYITNPHDDALIHRALNYHWIEHHKEIYG